MKRDLGELLAEWYVMSPGMWKNDISSLIEEWWAVGNTKDIVAYFGNEKDAYRFRLNEINRILNE